MGSNLSIAAALAQMEAKSALIREIQERWGPKLRHHIQPRSVSATLRRWAANGQIRLVRDGRSYYEYAVHEAVGREAGRGAPTTPLARASFTGNAGAPPACPEKSAERRPL